MDQTNYDQEVAKMVDVPFRLGDPRKAFPDFIKNHLIYFNEDLAEWVHVSSLANKNDRYTLKTNGNQDGQNYWVLNAPVKVVVNADGVNQLYIVASPDGEISQAVKRIYNFANAFIGLIDGCDDYFAPFEINFDWPLNVSKYLWTSPKTATAESILSTEKAIGLYFKIYLNVNHEKRAVYLNMSLNGISDRIIKRPKISDFKKKLAKDIEFSSKLRGNVGSIVREKFF